MQMVFIEGVPGSGKSAMAQQLCSHLMGLGNDARWYLEESHDNPLRMKIGNTLSSPGRFAEECLSSWARFVDQCAGQKTVHIVEGVAFQSTVRFMMEMREDGIERYYRRFEEIVGCLNPKMVYLRPQEVTSHCAGICELRGKVWANRVSCYLAKTQYAKHHGLDGLGGMHQFWAEYASLCDGLLLKTRIPTITINFVSGEWDRHMAEACAFLHLQRFSNAANVNGLSLPQYTGVLRQSAILTCQN
jgi:hypothetical protein